MKKSAIIIVAALGFLGVSCKKDKDQVSQVVKVGFPTVTFNGLSITGNSLEQYYLQSADESQTVFGSFPTGATNTNPPTAYDSVNKQSVPVETVVDGALQPNVPGLYVYDFMTGITAYGYAAYVRYFIAVTNISASWDLSGTYRGVIGNSTDTLDDIEVIPYDRGLYFITDPVADKSQIGLFFVQTTDTNIVIGNQPTVYNAQSYGDISGSGRVDTMTVDSVFRTVLSYRLVNPVVNAQYPANTIFKLIKQ